MKAGGRGRAVTIWAALATTAICAMGARASTEVPTEGLLLWLRADRPGQRDESGAIGVWENQAPGSPLDASQGEASRRPRWTAPIGSLGGQPTVEFDGRDDFLHLPWLRIGARATVIVVAEKAEQTAGGSHWRTLLGGDDDSFRDGATKYAFGFRNADYDPAFIACLYHAPGKPHLLTETTGPTRQTGFHAFHFRRDGSAAAGMTLRVDGSPSAELTADKDPAGFPGTGYTIGQGGDVTARRPSRFYRGRIAEILIYDRPLAEIERLRTEEYLASKYHLPREEAPPARGLALWLRADTLRGSAAGQAVDIWLDQSGNGHHAAQPEPPHRPAYRRREINGRPALEFGDRARLDFGDWCPPSRGSVLAVARGPRDRRARIARELPAIDPKWAADGKGRFAGLLSEVLVYDRVLSRDEEQEIGRYLDLRYSESPDPRNFENGALIFRNGYNDQPYVVKCRDGSWLCVITTGAVEEKGEDRTLVVTRSRDQGRTWEAPRYAIEPPEMRQPSWATLYCAPYGRVYVLYNLREHPTDRRSRVGYFMKYSDDLGETWSPERHAIPIREIALDREPGGTGGWSVCPPIEVGTDVLVSYTRFGPKGRGRGQGFVFRSDNLRSERDPSKIRWEMLPAGDHGIRANDVESDMQEEHIISPLANGDLFCIWRTTAGHACQSYSRDGGRTWPERGRATYAPGARPIKHPLACCRPFRTSGGRYLLWFHNSESLGPTAVYRPRDVVWLAGGEERGGIIHWSQPEVLMYGFDLPVRGTGMSYPDFIEEDGRFWVTTTDKEDARIFEIDPALLEGLWNQGGRRDLPGEGPVLDLGIDACQKAGPQKPVAPPNLLHGGFTVDLVIRPEDLRPDQTVVDCRTGEGSGWAVRTAEGGALRIELDDGRNPREGWGTDPGLLRKGRDHHITFIVDGGPNLIMALVDGTLCDGGDGATRGWGRFSRRLMAFGTERATPRIGPNPGGRLTRFRLYDRPLRVAEVIALQR